MYCYKIRQLPNKMRKKAEIKVLYIVTDNKNNTKIIRYLSKIENLTGILKTTISKHFNKYKEPYKNSQYTILKCENIDLNGYYNNNFR